MNTFINNFKRFIILMDRNRMVFTKQLSSTLIDQTIMIGIYVIVFGHFFPLLGMSNSYVAPVYVGNMILLVISIGSGIAFALIFDIQYHHFLQYELILPIPKRWLFASYVGNFLLHFIFATLPLFFFGIVLLGNLFSVTQAQWIPFIFLYLLSLIFIALMLLTSTFRYPYDWYMANIWARRINLLLTFSCLFVTWTQVYELSHALGFLFLLNPVTYMVEGLRSTLLDPTLYLCPLYCSSALLIFILLMLWALKQSIYRRLDPV